MASLYEVVLDQRFEGQQVINRFNYLGSGTPAAVTMSFALISAMGFIADGGVYPAGLFSSIRDLQSSDLTYVEAVAKDVYSNTDFYSLPFTTLGGNVSPASGNQPPFVAYSFYTTRVRSDIRRGQRRFAGLVEGSVDSYGMLTSGNLALAGDLADWMDQILVYDDEGTDLTFIPVIVSKEKYTVPESGKDAYKYYDTFAEQEDHLAQGFEWAVRPQITTQNSRKVGRGS
jgi:hypothetical protein